MRNSKSIGAFKNASLLAPTKANFPWLNHLILFSELTGETFYDSVSGLGVGGTVGLNISDGGYNNRKTTGTVNVVDAGAVSNDPTKHLMLLLACASEGTASGAAAFGKGNSSFIASDLAISAITHGIGTCNLANGAAVINGPNLSNGNTLPKIFATTYKLGTNGATLYNGITGFAYDGTTYDTPLSAGDLSTTSTLTLANAVLIGAEVRPALLCLGSFTTLPSPDSIKAGLQWMYDRVFDPAYLQENKVLPPWWMGLS